MRALATLLGVLGPVATITGVAFGIVWKIKHPHTTIMRAETRTGRIVKTILLAGLVTLVLIAMVVFGVAMIRTAFDPSLT